MHWIWAAVTSLSFPNLASRVPFRFKGKAIYENSHFGYEKFLQIGKLTYSTYLNLTNFCLEFILKSQSVQACILKFCYHKLRKFKLNTAV